MSGRAIGYIFAGAGGRVLSKSDFLFIDAFNVLWIIGDGEHCLSVSGDVNYIYHRTTGAVGVACGDDFFYEFSGGDLVQVKPDFHDLSGGALYKEFYWETEYSNSSACVTHRLRRAAGEVVVELSGEDLDFVGVWQGLYIGFQQGVGVISSRGDGVWEVIYVPKMHRVKYEHCIDKYLLLFGKSEGGQAVCELYDLEVGEFIGDFSFDTYPGVVTDIYEYASGWYFLWGVSLFRFDGRCLEEALPGTNVAGYYLTDRGVCVLSSDDSFMRFYDLDLCRVIEEVQVMPGYTFGCCWSEGDKLVGYMHPVNRTGGLCYSLNVPKSNFGCPQIDFEEPIFKTERRLNGKIFDVIVNFSTDEIFPKILRHALAVLNDFFSQYKDASINPDAAHFSGLVELCFDGDLPSEQKDLLVVNCRNISALACREAPATGHPFDFKLTFPGQGGDTKTS